MQGASVTNAAAMMRGQSDSGRRDEKSVDEKVGERARQKRATNPALILPTLCLSLSLSLSPPASPHCYIYCVQYFNYSHGCRNPFID